MKFPGKTALRREIDEVFANESIPDFNSDEVKARVAASLAELAARPRSWTHSYPHMFGGKPYLASTLAGYYASHDPYSGEAVGYFQNYDPANMPTGELLDGVAHAQMIWSEIPWRMRAAYLYALAKKLQSPEWTWRFVAALMLEVGKSGPEAYGEYNEVYRFVFQHVWWMYKRYTDASDLIASPAFTGDFFGFSFKGKGIGLVVAPFNFPAAIPVRMLTLMLAFGNVGILKGSDKASLVTQLIYEACEETRTETGIGPAGMVNFAPGAGGELVNALLADPRVKIVSFTGSSAVCESMLRQHEFSPRLGGNQLIVGSAETGGVNWIVIDGYSDIAYVGAQCVRANFGISGQKCSSARIVFVPRAQYGALMAAIKENYDKLRYGRVLDGADLGPVISREARDRITAQMKTLRDKGITMTAYQKAITQSPSENDVPPTVMLATGNIMKDKERLCELLNTEIFGPVMTVVPYDDLADVLAAKSLARYALTGAYFSLYPEKLARGMMWLPAGNAYGNRRSTGATAAEAFGGLGGSMSSYNRGLKGFDEVALYTNVRTHSAVFHSGWDREVRDNFAKIVSEHGVVVRK